MGAGEIPLPFLKGKLARVLISGINGFAASHLAERLLSSGHEVHGTTRIRSKNENIKDIESKLFLHSCDINDPFGVASVVKGVQPSHIFHLAAQSFVGWSWTHPEETLKTNILGTLNLLEAARNFCPEARIHIASSSQVYGKVSLEDQPMGKETLFNPMNPYDTSKLAQDMLALQYFNSYNLKVIRTRAFNISGPRRGDSFAESSWAKQIAEIENGAPGIIKHGNLESARDYIDVRDVVEGYEKACFQGEPGNLYILGSGTPRTMKEIMETLLSLTSKEIVLVQDPSRMRPSDTPYMKSDTSDLDFLIGHPLIPFQKTMTDLLNYHRIRNLNEKNLSSFSAHTI